MCFVPWSNCAPQSIGPYEWPMDFTDRKGEDSSRIFWKTSTLWYLSCARIPWLGCRQCKHTLLSLRLLLRLW